MMVTLIATCGVSAILVGVIVALGRIEQRLAPGGCRARVAADSSWPLGPTAHRRADAPFADRRRTGRMLQIIAGGGANPQLANRSNNGH